MDPFVSPLLGNLLSKAFFSEFQECVDNLAACYGVELQFWRARLEVARDKWIDEIYRLFQNFPFDPRDKDAWRPVLSAFGPYLCASNAVIAMSSEPTGDLLSRFPTQYVALQYLFEKHCQIVIVSGNSPRLDNLHLIRPTFVPRERVHQVILAIVTNSDLARDYARLLHLSD